MTSSESPEADRRMLGRLVRDRRAAETLGELIRPSTHGQLEIDCSQVTQIDMFGAAVIRAALDAHLCADPRHGATLIEPEASDVWPFLADALGGLPPGAKWAGTRSLAPWGTDVLIPATAVRAEDRPLFEYAIESAAFALQKGELPGRVLQEAAHVFLANVDEHAPDGAISPVLCAGFDPVSRNLQLVCVNVSPTGAPLPQTIDDVAALVDETSRPFRSIATLAKRRRGDLDFTIRLITGAGQARHRTGGRWTSTIGKTFVPGFVAAIEVHQ